jgi:hypothetical protein
MECVRAPVETTKAPPVIKPPREELPHSRNRTRKFRLLAAAKLLMERPQSGSVFFKHSRKLQVADRHGSLSGLLLVRRFLLYECKTI